MNEETPITIEIVDGANYTRDEAGWEHNAYTVEFRRGDVTMRVPWRQGLGHTDDPDAASVLEALLSDAATFANASSFYEWAEDLDFDTDSRKAERIYLQVEEQTARLRELLGDDFDAAVFPAGDDDSERVARRLAAAR